MITPDPNTTYYLLTQMKWDFYSFLFQIPESFTPSLRVSLLGREPLWNTTHGIELPRRSLREVPCRPLLQEHPRCPHLQDHHRRQLPSCLINIPVGHSFMSIPVDHFNEHEQFLSDDIFERTLLWLSLLL